MGLRIVRARILPLGLGSQEVVHPRADQVLPDRDQGPSLGQDPSHEVDQSREVNQSREVDQSPDQEVSLSQDHLVDLSQEQVLYREKGIIATRV